MTPRAGIRAIALAAASVAALPPGADVRAEVRVTKTAETTFVRTYLWDIDKTADQDALTLSVGQTASVNYEVDVTRTGYVDTDWGVSGLISIFNPDTVPYTLVSVADLTSGGILAAVDCGAAVFAFTLAPGATLQCSYSASLPDGSNRLNTAAVTLNTGEQWTGTANVTFSDPTTLVNSTVSIEDSFAGAFGSVSDSASFTYGRLFGAGLGIGEYSFDNTATIVETGQSDSFTVRVSVVSAPATVALLGIGVAGLAAARRRQTRWPGGLLPAPT